MGCLCVCKWSHYTQNKSLTCDVAFPLLFARISFQALRTSIQLGISVLVMPFLLNPATLFVLLQVARHSAAARTAVSLKLCLFGSLEGSSVWGSNSSNNPWAKSVPLAIQWANDQIHLNVCSLMLFSGTHQYTLQVLQVEFYPIVCHLHRFSYSTISVSTVTFDGSEVAECSYPHRYLPKQAEAQKAAFRPSLPILCWLWIQSFSTAKQAR